MNLVVESSSKNRLASGRHLPERPVVLVPGYHFFVETTPVPANTAAKELAGLAALAVESESPFSDEQLASAHFGGSQYGGLVAMAALRRKFSGFQEEWNRAGFVVPDFATWLPRGEAIPGVVILETPAAVTALEYQNGSVLPRRVVSRPVPESDDPEVAIEAARERVLELVVPAGRRVRRYRLGSEPCHVKGGKYCFDWEARDFVPSKSVESGSLSAAQLWSMDLRTADSIRIKRRDYQWNRYAWGLLVGIGVAAGLLLLGEGALLGMKVANSRRANRIEMQEPAARESEANQDIVNRLAGYIDRKPQPLELLAYVNDLRPNAVYFTKVSVDGGLQMMIDGATSSLAEVNEYEAALRNAPGLASVELKNVRAREGGGTFQLVLGFRPGFAMAAVPAKEEPVPAEALPQPMDGATRSPEAGPPRIDRVGRMPPQFRPRPDRSGLPPGMEPPPGPPPAPESSNGEVSQ